MCSQKVRLSTLDARLYITIGALGTALGRLLCERLNTDGAAFIVIYLFLLVRLGDLLLCCCLLHELIFRCRHHVYETIREIRTPIFGLKH